MASKGFTGRGGSVSISVDSGATYTRVGQVKSVKFGGTKSDFTDITNLDSVGNIRERVPTLIDPGTVTFDVVANQQDAGQLLLNGAFFAQQIMFVKVQYPPMQGMTTGLLKDFTAYVTAPGAPDLNVAEASTFTSELTITGPITDTPGA